MKQCKNCQINLNSTSSFCPLCQNKLVGEIENIIFPKIKVPKQNLFFKKLIFFSCSFLLLMILLRPLSELKPALGLILSIDMIMLQIFKKTNFLLRIGILAITLSFLWYWILKKTIFLMIGILGILFTLILFLGLFLFAFDSLKEKVKKILNY